MIQQLTQVLAFMRAFEQDHALHPRAEVHENLCALGSRLAREELYEMERSFGHPNEDEMCQIDQVECLDALCDQLYILLGNVHRFGFGLVFPAAFRRVHESNMTKLWTAEELREPKNKNRLRNCSWRPIKGPYTDDPKARVWRVTDDGGKVVKSPSYTPADLHDMLDELEGQELLNFTSATAIIYGDDPEPDAELEGFGIVFNTQDTDATYSDEEE